MIEVLRTGTYYPTEEQILDNVTNGEIREINGKKQIIALGKYINDEFAFADLEGLRASALEMEPNEKGKIQFAYVEVADEHLPPLLQTLSGIIYAHESVMSEPDQDIQDFLNELNSKSNAEIN